MTLAGFRAACYRLARTAGDVQAIEKGRVGKRVERRIVGRFFPWIIRGLVK